MAVQSGIGPGFKWPSSQKRLGDGFYEQRLLREQVLQLTGRRFLGDYASDQAEFLALMNNARTYARAWQLVPGVALTAAQMAQLTSDIVWLVEHSVTLADGSLQKVLVPQLYVRVREGDLAASGALIAGNAVDIAAKGDLTNSGSIAGRQVVSLTADNIRNLGGRIGGDVVSAAARTDLDNIGGTITAASALYATAGRDINNTSTVRTDDDVRSVASRQSTAVDRVAGLYVTGASGQPGVLVASAGRDVNLDGSTIANGSKGGATYVSAERDIHLRTLATSSGSSTVMDARNYQRQSQAGEAGSSIQGAGSVSLSAGHDITARQANVQAGGALVVNAGHDIRIESGEAGRSADLASHSESKGLLSRGSSTLRISSASTEAVASSFGGGTVMMVGGNDISVHGSNVVGDHGTTLIATNNVSITAAQNSYSSSQFSEEKKSGLMGSGGIGFTIGKRSQSGNGQESGTTAAGSTVGAIDGNVVIRAGNTYTQTGSDVVAPGGDVDIRAKRVLITEARETRDSRSEQQASQSGLTVSLTSPVLSGAQAMASTARSVGQTGDGRMKALGAATIALQGNQMAGSLGSAPSVADGITLNIALGSSHSRSSSTAHNDTAKGSTVKAGGNVSIVATGAGQDSNLLIQGSDVSAGGVAKLRADNKVILRAADNFASQSSDNSASSASFGVSVGLGKAPVTLNARASRANGNANGSDAWSSNTHVGSGSAVDIKSGGDLVMDACVRIARYHGPLAHPADLVLLHDTLY